MDTMNELNLVMSEITSGLSNVNMDNYFKIAFLIIGILFLILVIRLIINGINRG